VFPQLYVNQYPGTSPDGAGSLIWAPVVSLMSSMSKLPPPLVVLPLLELLPLPELFVLLTEPEPVFDVEPPDVVLLELLLVVDEQATAHAKPVNPRIERAKERGFLDISVSLSRVVVLWHAMNSAAAQSPRGRRVAPRYRPEEHAVDRSAPLI
jgi:hypothetical protein